MARYMGPIMLSVLTAGMLLTGCNKSPEQKIGDASDKVGDAKAKVGEAQQELTEAKSEYVAEWKSFKEASEKTIAANEKRIDAFKEKMDKGSSAMKAKYSADVAALEQKNRDLKRKLDEYRGGGETNWEEFKTNFNRDMDAVGKTISDLFKDND
jgi:predicted  nucleic acid-binding Zn-ribbon protein